MHSRSTRPGRCELRVADRSPPCSFRRPHLSARTRNSNAKAGHPSKGLFQTIDGTFNRYKLPGHGDIWNPVDNAAAAMQYIKARYGTIFNINPRTGYADGGLVHLKNFDGGGVVGPGWNAIRNDTGRDEHLVPAGAGIAIGAVNLNDREDVAEFWARAEFHAMKGTFG